jgi:sirohydrochlorin ferrochelatase
MNSDDKIRGLIFIAHGSRNKTSNEQITALANTIAINSKNKYVHTAHAFLEFAKPSIHDAINQQIEAGVNEIKIFPYFLSNGNHVSKDIFEIVQTFKASFPDINFVMLPVFGSHPNIENLIQQMI